MSSVFVIIKMCYVHNQWYDISCATLYFGYEHLFYPPKLQRNTGRRRKSITVTPDIASTKVCEKKFPVTQCFDIPPQIAVTNIGDMQGLDCTYNLKKEIKTTSNWKPPNGWLKINFHRLVSNYQSNAHFLYSITIYILHYNP